MALPPSRHGSPSRSSNKTVLQVGGIAVASVGKHSGGEAYAEVLNEPGGLLPYTKKSVGPLRFADLEVQVSVDAHPSLLSWIRDAWFGKPARDRIAIETADGSGTRSIELAQARIHEVVLPELDLGSRERRYLGLRILPRGIRRTQGGAVHALQHPERDFHAANFSVEIQGIDCSGVLSVDAVIVRAELPEDHGGRQTKIVFPDLHLHVDEDKAGPFRDWFDDFVITGNNSDDQELAGAITYLDPLLIEPLAVLQLHHLGIYRVHDEPPPPSGPRRVRVDLYCERMELTHSERRPTGDTEELAPVVV
jgi:hypothetical protein